MNLATPETIRKLQRALYAKAKGSPDYRFYTLYDKVYRDDMLAHAYRCSRTNDGAPGVDGQTFEEIEAYGVERWLGELAQTLRDNTYQAAPIGRSYVPKPNGQQRPLGIATIRDRVVQTAAMLVLEPIFEADLLAEQYAYRPKRRALDAVQQVHRLVCTGHTEVIDGDLSGYFDAIPHAELMTSLARRISDSTLLALIKQWLVAPVEEAGRQGRRNRTTPYKDSRRGIAQGSPVSPLLSNVYMRRFILGCVFQRIRPPIPAESGRLVQRKPATYSSGIWPPIPAESGRLIHRKPATQSKGKRPPVMAVRSGSFYSYCVSV